MVSERIQRHIDRLLNDADEGLTRFAWNAVRQRAEAVLRFDPAKIDALSFMRTANHDAGASDAPQTASHVPSPVKPSGNVPTSFADGHYQVEKFLGEGFWKLRPRPIISLRLRLT